MRLLTVGEMIRNMAVIFTCLAGFSLADTIPNPEFPFWKDHPVGSSVTFVTKTYDTERDPDKKDEGGKRELVNTKIVVSTITSVADKGVKTLRKTTLPATARRGEQVVEEDFTHASTWDEKYKVEYKDLGVEKVTVAGGAFECTKLQRVEKSEYAETVITKWWSKEVPGGLVKLVTKNEYSEAVGEVTEFKVAN